MKTPKNTVDIPTTAPERLALLVPVSHENEADGEVISGPEVGGSWVRRFTDEDMKLAKSRLPQIEQRRFMLLCDLKEAMGSPILLDDKIKQRAARLHLDIEQQQHHFEKKQQLPDSVSTPEAKVLGKRVSPLIGLPPEEAYAHLFGLHTGPRALNDPEQFYSYEVSGAIGLPLPAHWRSFDGQMHSGFCCMNEKAALYLRTFFFASKHKCGWRTCRWCEEAFFQKHPLDAYCRKTCVENAKKKRDRDSKHAKAASRRLVD